MNANRLAHTFTANGARLKMQLTEPRYWQEDHYAIDIRRDRHGEQLALRLPQKLRATLDLTILQANKGNRHFVVLVARFPRVAEAD